MAFEAEVFPLMIAGVLVVTALELFFGLALLPEKSARRKLIGHALWMLAAFFFLLRCVFGGRLGVEAAIPSISNSAGLGLFGICWAISVACVIGLIGELKKKE